MWLGSMPGIWLINEGLILFGSCWANSGGAAEVSENPTLIVLSNAQHCVFIDSSEV
jgi:hypothetical protein